MHDDEIRKAILRLSLEGHSQRKIATVLDISRTSVVKTLQAKTAEPEPQHPASALDEHGLLIQRLYRECKGNRVLVHQTLVQHGFEVAYTTLTGWCRNNNVGKKQKKAAGMYHFAPGQEMQHDTSPHRVVIDGKEHKLQCASLILCHSRMRYMQVFWRWNRLQARIFLSEAIVALGGAAAQCELDNSTVIIAHGTGKDAVVAAEMAAFAKRFRLRFEAHEVGDANRSAHVERAFYHVERNFYPGKTFTDLADCNRQLRQWCVEKNERFMRHLQARPVDLYALEQAHLQPLPVYIPEVYASEPRIVDQQGLVQLHTNRYSVPAHLVGKTVEVREYKEKMTVWLNRKQVAEHALWRPGCFHCQRDEKHRDPEGIPESVQRRQPSDEELRLRAQGPELDSYIQGLRQHRPGRAVVALRRLERLWHEYPPDAVLAAVVEANKYRLFDVGRLENMVLQGVAREFFQLSLGLDDEQ